MSWYMGFFMFSVVLYAGVTVAIKLVERRMRKKPLAVVADNTMTNVDSADNSKKTL